MNVAYFQGKLEIVEIDWTQKEIKGENPYFNNTILVSFKASNGLWFLIVKLSISGFAYVVVDSPSQITEPLDPEKVVVNKPQSWDDLCCKLVFFGLNDDSRYSLGLDVVIIREIWSLLMPFDVLRVVKNHNNFTTQRMIDLINNLDPEEKRKIIHGIL
jgi:hypothetical protein